VSHAALTTADLVPDKAPDGCNSLRAPLGSVFWSEAALVSLNACSASGSLSGPCNSGSHPERLFGKESARS
jgi:hypothetical protein